MVEFRNDSQELAAFVLSIFVFAVSGFFPWSRILP
jgi:hypothetical protein